MTIIRPDVVRRALLTRTAEAYVIEDLSLNPKLRGALVGHINSALDNGQIKVDEARRWLLGWLFCPDDLSPEPMSSNDLSEQQLWALRRWIGAEKVNDQWVTRPTFGAECRWAYNWAMYDAERMLHSGEDMLMRDLLEFWAQHGFDLNEDEQMASAVLHVGGVLVKTDAPPKPGNTDNMVFSGVPVDEGEIEPVEELLPEL